MQDEVRSDAHLPKTHIQQLDESPASSPRIRLYILYLFLIGDRGIVVRHGAQPKIDLQQLLLRSASATANPVPKQIPVHCRCVQSTQGRPAARPRTR